MLPIKLGNFDRELFYKVPTILDWLPIRIKAAHFCYNDPLLQSLIAVSRLTCGPEVRSKYRTHRGKYVKMLKYDHHDISLTTRTPK